MAEENPWNPCREKIDRYCKDLNTDLFLYSGDINLVGSERFIDSVEGKTDRAPHASLFLTTYGGDIHRAYRMIRSLKSHYQVIRLLVVGPCKSAGTIIAIGSDIVSFGYRGELGPLDVQLSKEDEIIGRNSGLDRTQALALLTQHSFQTFEQYLVAITSSSRGSISTVTASQIACNLVTGLMKPIAAQLDPIGLGESRRALEIATQYGERLATKKDFSRESKKKFQQLVANLVTGYPSHDFVIDQEEFGDIVSGIDGLKVDSLTAEEVEICKEMWFWLNYPQSTNEEITMDLPVWIRGLTDVSKGSGTGSDAESANEGGDED